MEWIAGGSFGLGVLGAWTLLWEKVIRERDHQGRALLIALALLLLGSLPLVWTRYQDHQIRQAFTTAGEALVERYQPEKVSEIIKLENAWFYRYTLEGEEHQVLRIGDAWWPITFQTQEAPP